MFLLPAPTYYLPFPGIEVDLKSIIGAGLYCGNSAFGSSG